MAEKKRKEITQALCRQVQLLIKGGASNREAGEITGTSAATVSRIRTAEYDAYKYHLNNTKRNEEEKKQANIQQDQETCATDPGDMQPAEDNQVPGQIKMFFPGEGKEPYPIYDENKIMRFLAGKMGEVTSKLDKLNDNLCQILRRLDR